MRLAAFLQRYFGVVVGVLLASSVYFQAAGLSQLIEAALVEPLHLSRPTYSVRPTHSRTVGSAASILTRNAFDSYTGSLTQDTPDLETLMAEGIWQVSDTEYGIDRIILGVFMEDQVRYLDRRCGMPRNERFRMHWFGIRPETLMGRLGLRNGDRLDAINGVALTGPEQAIQAYAQLRAADAFTFELNRRGERVEIEYVVR